MPLCKYPITVQAAGGVVPCGQCLPCRMNRRKKKTTRLVLESQMHEHAVFVTLTYMDKYLPRDIYNPRTGEVSFSHPLGCLDKRAVQLFIKRLRKNVPGYPLRYFAVGEYGEKNGRPHYHLVIFGLPQNLWHYIQKSWSDPHTKELMCDPDRLTMEEPRSSWDVGQYCVSYMMKNMSRPDAKGLDGRPPEFFLSSKSLGLSAVDPIVRSLQNPSGDCYIEREGDIPRVLHLNGKAMPIDRYLREKILLKMGNHDALKKIGQEKFAQEMSELFARAQKNPKIPKQWFAGAVGTDKHAHRYRDQILKTQFAAEQAQAVLNVERRADLTSKDRTKI